MKIVLFGPERRIGAWQNDKVIDLNRALANYLRDQRGETNAQARADEKIPLRLERFIALGKAAIEDAQRAIEHATKYGAEGVVHDVKSVKLHAPWPERRIACVGGNYAAPRSFANVVSSNVNTLHASCLCKDRSASQKAINSAFNSEGAPNNLPSSLWSKFPQR